MEEHKNKNLVDDILNKFSKDVILYMTAEGIMESKIEDLINQPLDSILYDLNRDKATLTSQALSSKSLRFVNDFAMANVLSYLYNENKKLKAENQNLKLTSTQKRYPLVSETKREENKRLANQIQEGFNTSLEINM